MSSAIPVYLFLLEPHKGYTSQEQVRDIRSLLKHSVQENSEVKERGVASLTGRIHIESLVYQSHLTLFLKKYWLWKKCLAQTSRTVNSSWLHICIKHRSSGRCAFLSGPPAAVSQLCSTAKHDVSLLQLWILSMWILFTWWCLFLGLITDKYWITPSLFFSWS